MKSLYDFKYFKASSKFQKNKMRLDKLLEVIKLYHPKTVLDVGCGLGFLVNKLNDESISAIGIDFSPDLKKYFWGNNISLSVADAKDMPFDNKSFDLVFSSDFFEHIDEIDVPRVANEMKRVGKKVIAFVADSNGEKLHYRQTLYHVTHKDLDWWKEKLQGIKVFSSRI